MCSPIFKSLIWQNFGLFALFRSLGFEVRFKNFVCTYICKQSTLVLEVQPYLFFLIHPHFGPLLHFFWALFALGGCFWSRGQVQKHFCNLLMKSISCDFGSTALFFCFYLGQIWGLFCPFWAFWGYFWG